MRRPPLISLSVKVGLVLFAVVAGALAIVYLAVVPRLENRLVDAKIDELKQAAPRWLAGRRAWVEPIFLREMAPEQAGCTMRGFSCSRG